VHGDGDDKENPIPNGALQKGGEMENHYKNAEDFNANSNYAKAKQAEAESNARMEAARVARAQAAAKRFGNSLNEAAQKTNLLFATGALAMSTAETFNRFQISKTVNQGTNYTRLLGINYGKTFAGRNYLTSSINTIKASPIAKAGGLFAAAGFAFQTTSMLAKAYTNSINMSDIVDYATSGAMLYSAARVATYSNPWIGGALLAYSVADYYGYGFGGIMKKTGLDSKFNTSGVAPLVNSYFKW
jgi:hypothetical protein